MRSGSWETAAATPPRSTFVLDDEIDDRAPTMALGIKHRPTIPGPSAAPVFSPRDATAVIPFDHAARFELRGIPGNIVQDVINIDSDGVFVAVGVSYGLLQERGERLEIFNPVQPIDKIPGKITLGDLPVQ